MTGREEANAKAHTVAQESSYLKGDKEWLREGPQAGGLSSESSTESR